MALSKRNLLVVCATLGLSACSFASDALFPSAGGGGESDAGAGTQPYQAQAGSPPSLGETSFQAPGVTPGQPTGTFVGQKVQQYRSELTQLQTQIRQHNQRLQGLRNQVAGNSRSYHGTVAAISSRLQVGTTPGNPVLREQWSAAQEELNQINSDVVQMNQLAAEVSSDSAMAGYLLDSVRAARALSGAVDEDHRQLRVLEDETNQTVVLIERLLNELNRDITRQREYVESEKANLSALAVAIKNGHFFTGSVTGREIPTDNANLWGAQGQTGSVQGGFAARGMGGMQGATAFSERRPLVVVRFGGQTPRYEQALYEAATRALDRKPGAVFDVVAVTPTGQAPGQTALAANQARQNAEQVMRSLMDMGLPADRIRLSAMTSQTADNNQVHVYVR